jgi:hypothetical protein
MEMMSSENHDRDLDGQIHRLTPDLREKGIAPGEDLWPGIEAAMERAEGERPSVRPNSGGRIWRLAAVAASLALILGLGHVGTMDTSSHLAQAPSGPPQMASAEFFPVSDSRSELRKLDHTLGELNQALSQDPDNRNLSRLVLLVHRSRADLLRHNTQNL